MVDYPIPGNDDAIRSIQLFCKEISEAILEGRSENKDEQNEQGEQIAPVTNEEKQEILDEVTAEVATQMQEEA
jgi:small subunit ribosomal protein S2